ncbi:hypothetical protein A2U01_0108964, partial [Trifolium medium]|nr:hypothetical protein [Trifolium medium]
LPERAAPTPEEKHGKQDYTARRAAYSRASRRRQKPICPAAMQLRVAPHECARRAT